VWPHRATGDRRSPARRSSRLDSRCGREPEDLNRNLLVHLGIVTEPLNRHWFERNTGLVIKEVQRWIRHPVIRWLAATLDGVIESTGAVFEAKFMLPWYFPRKQRPKGIWPSSSTTCGLPTPP
jgi:hypothetical protein